MRFPNNEARLEYPGVRHYCCIAAALAVENPDARNSFPWTGETVPPMIGKDPQFDIRLAMDEADILSAQRLRYSVFVEELGGDGDMVDHAGRLERDEFDPYCDHLILIDRDRKTHGPDCAIGAYRLMTSVRARAMGRFYSENEYDLTPLKASGLELLELGRSCLHPDYRGGTAMFHLWNGLAEYVLENGVEILFGVASFHGVRPECFAESLSCLHHDYLAPPDLRVRAVAGHFQRMDLVPPRLIDRKRAMVAMPALIKAYLRLGGFVGEGAFIDQAFNTTDVCLLMDTARLNPRHRDLYVRGRSA